MVFSLDTVDSTTAVLARGAGLVGGLAFGAVIFVLIPLLRSTARGILFTPGSATRPTGGSGSQSQSRSWSRCWRCCARCAGCSGSC